MDLELNLEVTIAAMPHLSRLRRASLVDPQREVELHLAPLLAGYFGHKDSSATTHLLELEWRHHALLPPPLSPRASDSLLSAVLEVMQTLLTQRTRLRTGVYTWVSGHVRASRPLRMPQLPPSWAMRCSQAVGILGLLAVDVLFAW